MRSHLSTLVDSPVCSANFCLKLANISVRTTRLRSSSRSTALSRGTGWHRERRLRRYSLSCITGGTLTGRFATCWINRERKVAHTWLKLRYDLLQASTAESLEVEECRDLRLCLYTTR